MNLIISGGLGNIEKGIITTKPTYTKDAFNNDQISYTYVNSDIHFEEGEIEFQVKIESQNAICQAILSSETSEDVNVGLNILGNAYGIMKVNSKINQFEIVGGVGRPETIKLNEFIKIKIESIGSLLKVYINDIPVVVANQSLRKNILRFVTGDNHPVEIKNIKVNPRKPVAFVVMQFSEEYNNLYKEVIKPICEDFGFTVERADEFFTATPILSDIINSIKNSSIIIAEITPNNPNVFYEVGYAHAINKPTILLSDKRREKLPFDLSGFRTLFYENSIVGKTQVEKSLRKYLESYMK